MPNWVDSDLYVSGKAAEVKRFIRFAKGKRQGALDANKFIPYPENFASLDDEQALCMKKYDKMTMTQKKKWLEDNDNRFPKDGFNSGGYEWCIEHWGTKWGFCDTVLVKDKSTETKAVYRFATAWSPIIPVINEAATLFPKLRFRYDYFESGMAFKGSTVWENGVIIKQSESDYHGQRGG